MNRKIELNKQHKLPKQFLSYNLFKLFCAGFFIALAFSIIGYNFIYIFLSTEIFLLILGYLLFKIKWNFIFFSIGENKITKKHGIITKKEKSISFRNIQNVEVNRGPLQDAFGISDLEIWTASPEQSSNKKVGLKPDLDLILTKENASWLRNFILD